MVHQHFLASADALSCVFGLQLLRTLQCDALSFSADDLVHLTLEIFLEVRTTVFFEVQAHYTMHLEALEGDHKPSDSTETVGPAQSLQQQSCARRFSHLTLCCSLCFPRLAQSIGGKGSALCTHRISTPPCPNHSNATGFRSQAGSPGFLMCFFVCVCTFCRRRCAYLRP